MSVNPNIQAISVSVITPVDEAGRVIIETIVETDVAGVTPYFKLATAFDPNGPHPRRIKGPSIHPILLAAINQIDAINAAMLMHSAGRSDEKYLDPALLWVEGGAK